MRLVMPQRTIAIMHGILSYNPYLSAS